MRIVNLCIWAMSLLDKKQARRLSDEPVTYLFVT